MEKGNPMTTPHNEHHAHLPMSTTGIVARLIFAWVFVGIPLVWGVYQTYLTAKPLFERPPAAQHHD